MDHGASSSVTEQDVADVDVGGVRQSDDQAFTIAQRRQHAPAARAKANAHALDEKAVHQRAEHLRAT